jgi:nucleoside-diphosphate-sugar epimerase
VSQVLITGAAGFLGRHFLEHYRSQPNTTVVAVDTAKDHPEGVLRIDAMDVFTSGRVFDIALHFAAVVGGREVIENDPFQQVGNAALDAAFFNWATGHTKVAIYPSSSAVYGIKYQSDKGMKLAESMFHPSQTEWARADEWYGVEKMMAEYLECMASEKFGLNTLVLRPFSGYGEGQAASYPVTAICQRALNHEDPLQVWGSGHQSRDFVHVKDLVAATVVRLSRGVLGYVPMNIGTGVPVTFVEIAKAAAEIAGYNPKIVTDESKPEGVHARYADPSEMLQYYRPRVTLYQGLQKVMDSLSRAHASQ